MHPAFANCKEDGILVIDYLLYETKKTKMNQNKQTFFLNSSTNRSSIG